ncbi:MAG: prolyl oligopeptidase family serine peptidase [Cyclobacteriaceae bacterium]|nr:prolyl oligopeptidase family serine peptidase [Cyclobacteriaceae bacterium]
MVLRWLLAGVLIFNAFTSWSQLVTEIVADKSHREGTNFNPTCDTQPLCNYYKMVTWDDSSIKQYCYRGHQGGLSGPVAEFLNWRMAFPLNYDSARTQKYPMIVMLHGAGESGRIWSGNFNYPTSDIRFDNNGANLIHGGQQHLNAVNRNPSLSNAFPGIVIWPQATYNGAWENGWNNGQLNDTGEMVAKVIDWLIKTKNIDPDRIYVHGLSNGGKGTWEMATKRADLFAAALPMSGVGSNNVEMAKVLNTMPLWLFQGGLDTNPRPQAAVDAVAALQAEGGNPRYTYYPNLDHGVWNTAYAEPDFFSWMLSQSKKNIYVFGGDASICPGGTLKLGFSDKMLEYEWYKDEVAIANSNSRTYTANTTGVYKVRYRRRVVPKGESTDWAWSNPITIANKATSNFAPLLTNTGSTNLRVDLSGVDNRINFTAPAGFSQYYWFKGATQVATSPSNTRQISSGQGSSADEGSYTVKVLEATGCISASSNAINVNWYNLQPDSPRPIQPSLTSVSATQINLSWPDYSNEVGYELWRVRFTSNSYNYQEWQLIKVLPQNVTTYQDKGLRPDAQYDYLIRVLLPDGRAIFSSVGAEWPFEFTLEDNTPPTSPANLTATNISDTQVTLTWDPSLDNDRVYKYEIYNGSTLVTTLVGGAEGSPEPITTYTVTGLAAGMTYLFSVRALDFKSPSATDAQRNYSPFSNIVEVTTAGALSGLSFKYYTTTGLSGSGTNQLAEPYTTTNGPNFNFSAATPAQTGIVSNFTISGASGFQGGTSDPNNFVYAFDGFIRVPNSGNYRFFTRSDDGSRLYLENTLRVNNDGAHGATNVNSASINLTANTMYAIRVTYFENTGGQELGVRYSYSASGTPNSNYDNASAIPNSWLYQNATFVTNYYSKQTGNLTATASWGTNTDGNGTAPPNFTNNYTYYHVRNRASATLNASWTVSGTGSKVIVGDGNALIDFTIGSSLNGTVEANNNATINITSISVPKFGLLHSNSTVNFNADGTSIPNASYGHVKLNNAGVFNLPLSTTIIKGNLEFANGATTTGVSTNLTTLSIGGNLTINNNSGNPFPSNGGQQYSLIFTGGTTHTVSFSNPVDLSLFSIQTSFNDVVNFTGLSGRTFTLGSNQGGGLTLKNSSVLNLGTNNLIVTGRGTINSNNETGALAMTGGTLQVISTSDLNNTIAFAADSYLQNLTSTIPSNFRTGIVTPIKVNNLVTVGGGELNTGDGFLTLRSINDNGTGTARIGPLLNEARVTGKIKVQRYMSGEGRIYRYISSPVAGVTVADLQQYFPITGSFTGTSVIPNVTSGASMFHFTETAHPQYQPFPATGSTNLETLGRGIGYVPFIREGTAPTTWEITGEPYQGDIPFTLTGNPTDNINLGWNLLGNPYPAPIKWYEAGGWTMAGVGSIAYVRENYGTTTVVKSHDGTAGTNNWDGVIAPGQAFWVRTVQASPQLTVHETAKRTVDGAFYREDWPANTLAVKMQTATQSDNTIIRFVDGAHAAFDATVDGPKQNNSFFNISSLTSDNQALAINLTTTNYCEQEVKLRITDAPAGSYQLEITGAESLVSRDRVTFIDAFTHTEKIITGTELYNFAITADPASKADGRFALRFAKPEVVLNQTLKAVAACEQDSPLIKVNNAQPGVSYQAFVNGKAVSDNLTSTGGVLEIPVFADLLPMGQTVTHLKAGFKSCNLYDLPVTIAVQRDTLPPPTLKATGTLLEVSTQGASYQWYYNGKELEKQTSRTLLGPEEGTYYVEVTKATCKKITDTLDYVITAIEKPNRVKKLYPNPTRDRVVVEMQQPIDFETVQLVTTLGQVLRVPATRLTEVSAEIDLGSLPTGLYLLQVNTERFRLLKE